ncbi:hypothetical protein A2415_04640 [candidate division WWE3 bacterium RIFOXYC1_FULL_39_7]|uniref:Uncharacterized protein n=2 Tax=Katanobacteria TaxID=422282 RepID=A0A1F4X773_UNCKA|nr:MAG: hypothetical protein A2415_04640 [candidate division WWE3 bacterium RIFOXYC1_FULL_39_7]OGC77506.1 MAG: hypothetical protein A2619_01365 [candidate division WWE3 bacterium RIFOXYD1_FULL_39_9]
MLKAFLRSFVFTYITLYVIQYFLEPFSFEDPVRDFILVALALSILNRYLRSLLQMLSLPNDGFVYLLIFFVMNFITFNIIAVIIPQFSIQSAVTPNLIIFGFVLPSKNLTALWAGAVGTLLLTVIFNFFEWLASKK